MADQPASTGDPKLDELVRVHFTEAIDIIRQVLADRHPEMVNDYSEEWVGKTCAIIAVQTWPIFGALFAEGASADIAGLIKEPDPDGG